MTKQSILDHLDHEHEQAKRILDQEMDFNAIGQQLARVEQLLMEHWSEFADNSDGKYRSVTGGIEFAKRELAGGPGRERIAAKEVMTAAGNIISAGPPPIVKQEVDRLTSMLPSEAFSVWSPSDY